MRAAIVFNIYKDFTPYLKYFEDEYGDKVWDEDYGYKRALKVLNQLVQDLVEKEQLTILYKNRRCKIRTNIKGYECGNIFSPDEYDGPQWNGVEIWCEFPCKGEFDSSKLVVGRCPEGFQPTGRCWQ